MRDYASHIGIIFFVIGTCLSSGATNVSGQTLQENESETDRFTHFSSERYTISNQIWAIEESKSGWVFVAEQNGIRMFRGSDWRIIKSPNSTTIRSIAIHESASGNNPFRIFYGAQGDFGYVSVDNRGAFKATSLLETFSLPDSVRIGDVWATHIVNEEVFFQSEMYVFKYDGAGLKYWSSKTGYHNSFKSFDRLYVREKGRGLITYQSGGLSLVKNSEVLKDEKIFGITEEHDGESFIWSQNLGILAMEPKAGITKQIPYNSSLQKYSGSVRLYDIIKTNDESYLIATLGLGILSVSKDRSETFLHSEEHGIPDKVVNYLAKSVNNDIWLAFDSQGFGRLSSEVGMLRFGKKQGLSGNIYKIGKVSSSIGLATSQGLYFIEDWQQRGGPKSKIFSDQSTIKLSRKVSDFDFVWDFLETDNKLVVASESGVKIRTQSTGIEIWESCGLVESDGQQSTYKSFVIYEDKLSGKILVGLEKGIAWLNINEKSGEVKCHLQKLNVDDDNYDVRSLLLLDDGLLIGTHFSGVLRLPISKYKVLETEGFLHNDLHKIGGMPLGNSHLIEFKNNALVIVEDDLYTIQADYANPISFYQSEKSHAEVLKVFAAFPSNDLQLAVVSENRVDWYEFQSDTRLLLVRSPEALKFEKSSSSSIFIDQNEITWINDGNDLIRYDPQFIWENEKGFTNFVEKVSENSKSQIIFEGNFTNESGQLLLGQPASSIPVLSYDDRNISIQVSANDYVNPEAVQYRYKLDGTGKDWSDWDFESTRVFSTLTEGDYVFRAQAKDEVGRISEEVVYAFSILPPWYRTKWAYFGYLILIAGAVISAQKYVLMRRAHKEAKEQAIELERNRDVVKKLQEANNELTKANKLKDEFLATTSHELRTPLTAILGFTSVLKEEIPEDAEYREFLNIIEESGARLMDTLNSLLDLAKLRAGIMEINLEDLDVFEECSKAASNFQELARAKGIKLDIVKPDVRFVVTSDSHALGKIVHNLLSNAVKFTQEGEIEIKFRDAGDAIAMSVRDTGIGIEAQFLPDLFDAFIQESDGLSRSHEGTGLGLAICSGLVSLMDSASIRVESTKGEGTTFIVELPKADAPRNKKIRLSHPGFGATA